MSMFNIDKFIKKNPLITVIVPVYNAERYIKRCISSIQNNTYKNLEIILVNDGSKDNSGNICDEYAKTDNRIKVIHKKNAGTAAARNDALDVANGEYIAFCDNDDFISPYFYEVMIKAMINNESDVVVCEMTREEDYNFLTEHTNATPTLVDKHNFILGTYNMDWTRNTAPWNKLYRYSLFNDIRFPVGKGFEDAFTTYKLLFKAEKIVCVNEVLYCWYKNNESYSSKRDNPNKLCYREEAIRLQAFFYETDEYYDVKQSAIHFYINQLFIMIWQIDHDYKKIVSV